MGESDHYHPLIDFNFSILTDSLLELKNTTILATKTDLATPAQKFEIIGMLMLLADHF
jgi:hypothetical protein